MVPVTLSWRRSKRTEAMVDTGSTFLVLPASIARQIGVPGPVKRKRVTLADGTVRSFGETVAHVKIDGREAGAVALIVKSGEVLIGVEVLEALGLAVDPTKERLVPKRRYGVRLGWHSTIRLSRRS
jgi:clan AA aspartic protease